MPESTGRLLKCSICFFIQWHLEQYRVHRSTNGQRSLISQRTNPKVKDVQETRMGTWWQTG